MTVRPSDPAHLARYRSGYWDDQPLGDVARRGAESSPDAIAFDGDCPVTRAELVSDAEALAASLVELGLRRGDVIAQIMPNWVEAAVINLAAALGGWVVNPIVPIYRDAEVGQMLADGAARCVFTCVEFRGFGHAAMVDRLRAGLPRLSHVVTVRGTGTHGYSELLAAGRGRSLGESSTDPNAVKLLLYTSGTTGRPKGVLHSHNSLTRVAQVSYRAWGLGEGDGILMPSPVTHISGYCNGLEQPFLSGTRTVLMEQWNAAEAVTLIDRYQVAGTVGATPFLQELVTAARMQGTRLPSLRIFACGGAAVPAELIFEANRAFAQPCAFRVYGSSEVPLVTLGASASVEPRVAAETDGRAIDYELRLVDDEGADVPLGLEGEVLARGPAMFLGYLDPSETGEALTADGWFRSGDLGQLEDDGVLVITGRKKDLIIRGGENISAKEIEDVLHAHLDVTEAAVVSMPHPRLGEGVCAFVVRRSGATTGAEALAAFVIGSQLARQKVPERFEFVSDLPRTASGKVRKDVLRATIRAALGEAQRAPAHGEDANRKVLRYWERE